MQNSSIIHNFLGLVSGRYRSLTTLSNGNGNFLCELIVSSTMPKRIRSGSMHRSKKSRQSTSEPFNKRNLPTRSCKITSTSGKGIVDFNFLSLPTNMGLNQSKVNDKAKDKNIVKEASSSSDDELDVVYDVQEDKKNKIYEVITVMSDDETPNQVSYERLYADDPNKRFVDESEIKEILEKDKTPNKTRQSESDIVDEIVKEANMIKEKIANSMNTVTVSKEKRTDHGMVTSSINTNDDSDNEVICLAVLDAKTKAEQKKAAVEEICLSSDSEPESGSKIPPLRIQLPFSGYPYVNKYRFRPANHSENSIGSTNSSFPYSYPYRPPMENENCVSQWENNITNSRASSSEYSSDHSDSPEAVLCDDSSSSPLSDLYKNLSPRSESSENVSNSSSPTTSSSEEEEKDIYWKAERESRRKGELRYEEYTDFGKKVHEGEIDLDINTTFTFKVMSYNVLAQTLLESHMYLYKQHDRRALNWARRWALIYEEIKDENPEVLCLQEVDHTHLLSHYSKLLDLGYRWIYKKRTGDNHDGVAIFYKAAVFEVEANSTVEFFQPGVSVLDRHNVGLVMRLRLRNSPAQAVVVATTHLLYNPKRSDVRLAQVQVLLAEIDRLAYNKDAFKYYPVILTGDFNLKPCNGVYKLLTEGGLCYEGTSRKNLQTNDENLLPRVLLPFRLGITDRCQHVDVVEARVRGDDSTSTRLYHSEYNKLQWQEVSDNDDCNKDDRFESGTLRHGFNFLSAYPHIQADGKHEASTHHDHWTTVDYIFYSSPKTKQGQKKEEGALQLLSRLRLPAQDDCERFLKTLPNFAFGSDHLALVTKFLLHLQYPSAQVSERRNAVGSKPVIISAAQSKEKSPVSTLDNRDEAASIPRGRRRPVRQYSRDFLMKCRASPFTFSPPLKWDQITMECPSIAKKDSESRRPVQDHNRKLNN